jgi:hypothetical protein
MILPILLIASTALLNIASLYFHIRTALNIRDREHPKGRDHYYYSTACAHGKAPGVPVYL